MDIKVVLFDFDGVLSRGRFYEKELLPERADIHNWIQANIFGGKDSVKKWMRGQINSPDINRVISDSVGIDYETLRVLFEKSVREMVIEEDVLSLARLLKQKGKKVGIVTDNMDVFTQIVVLTHRLNEIFDVIINSADYGIVKKEENGKLFDIALNTLGEKIEDTLMIDDSASTIELYKQKGGHGFVYKNLPELKSFLGVS